MERGFYNQDRLIRHHLERFLPDDQPQRRWQRLTASNPLLFFTTAFIVGICLQAFITIALWIIFAAAGLMLLTFILSFFVFPAARLSMAISFCMAAGVFVCVGMLRYTAFATPPTDHIVRLSGQQRRLATLEGVIVSDIHHDNRSGWAFASYFPTPPQSSFYLSAHAIAAPNGWYNTTGLVRVQVAEIARHLRQGDRVRLVCWLDGFDPAANPGQFDMQRYMHQRGVWLGASVPAADGVEIQARGHGGAVAVLRNRLRTLASGALFEEADYHAPSASLAAALLLGQRSDLDDKTYAAFQRTGLAHFISLSGMHIGILAGSLWGVSRFFGLPKPLRAAICLALLVAYGLVVPPRAPTVRAIFLACFFFSAVILKRQTQPLNTLALSAMVLLLVRPTELFSASWQLSFITVLGILVLYEPLYQRLMSWSVFKAVEILPKRIIESPAVQWIMKAADGFIRLLSVGLAAWLGGVGVLLYHFYSITPLSSLWTVLTTPLVLIILYAGYLKIALTPIFPTAGLLCAVAMDWGCRAFAAAVRAFSEVPFSEIRTGFIAVGWIVAGYTVLALIRFAPRRIVILTGGVVIVLAAGSAGWRHWHNRGGELTLACLSVGHGQAIIIEFPDRTPWLIDAGSISQKNPGGRTVLPYLRYRGIAALEAVILTHGDMDHLNGLPEVAAALPVGGVFANASVFEKAQTSSSASFLMQRLKDTGQTIQPIETIELPDGATVRMLWPDAETAQNKAINDNDKSQVVWIQFGGRGVLLCGDIELYAQEKIAARFAGLKADVMVLPHHGSMNGLNPDFVAAFNPRIVIASCAAGRQANAYSPPPDSGIAAFYTPDDGAITINIKADGAVSAIGFKSQKTVRLN